MPDGAGALQARKLARGLCIGFDCWRIGCGHFKIADQPVMHRAAVTISHPYCDHRARYAVGNQD